MKVHRNVIALLVTFSLCVSGVMAAEPAYYKAPQLFSKAPDPGKSATTVARFGPVGMAIDLIQPAFTMQISSIEPGSPAAATGQLKAGQIIESINGQKLADIDPRIQLGNWITQSEASDGKMILMIAEKPGAVPREVVVQLAPKGAYSPTWPLNCPKSEKIVRDFAAYLKKPGSNKGFSDIGMLFLLSTGDESDLAVVRDWARSCPSKNIAAYSWHIGYGGLALAEYYLRTGDEQVMPAIQALTDHALKIETFGGWASRGPLNSPTYGGGGGHLNAGGTLVPAFLFLAAECGAKIPDDAMRRIAEHWYRFAGRGNVPYGNNRPEGTYTDNGKNGLLAFSMAAAASLTPDGEKSIYARARDVNALFSFCSTSFMLHGHTGGGIGEIWRSAAMGLLHDKQPALYRDFMDQRRWHYELSRRFDGSFGIIGGERYDSQEWGAGYALTYTVPRKTLRLTGAPPSKFSKQYQLPPRPWGTAADDDFESILAIAYPDGSRPDFSKDTLANGGGLALLGVARKKLTDEELAKYLRHPNIATRMGFIDSAAARGTPYILTMLSDPDARMRRLGLETVAKTKELPDPIFARIIAMLGDEKESLFVKELAMRLLGGATADQLAPHVDVVVSYMGHDEWWLQTAALQAVTLVATDKRCYERVLPAMGKLLKSNHLYNTTNPLRWGQLAEMLRKADPEVAALAKKCLKEAYTQYAAYDHPLPEVDATVNPSMREGIAQAIALLPGGLEALYEVAKQDSNKSLPYAELFLKADPIRYTPELKKVVDVLIKTRLIPEYVAANRSYLARERINQAIPQDYYYRGTRVEGLVDLYRRIGVNDYNWHDFGPAPTGMSWRYLTFDPPEAKAWDIAGWRYRKVTLPAGMENWFSLDFDPQKAGWKTGLQPFGATNGKLVGVTIDGSRTSEKPSECKYDFCRHGEPMKTLWDKEVLLMRGKFKFPVFKEGYRYRMLVGGMSHVGAGEGFRIYINGKQVWEKERGVDKREGAVPIDMHLDKSMWSTFSGQEVDIAHIGFMGVKGSWKNRQLMIWVQEMKLPPLDDDQFVHSATMVPMTCAQWQAQQDPDNADLDPNAGRYLWDGKFKPNPALLGSWKTVGYAPKADDFTPAKPGNAQSAPVKNLTFKADGRTDELLFIWSGTTLMNLVKNEAMNMELRKVGETEYLFIEAGGFQAKNGPAWQSPRFVMQRVN